MSLQIRPNLDKSFSFNHDLSDANYHALKSWSRRAILPELYDSEDLDGFTLGQIRDLWTLIFLESQLLTRIEIHTDALFGSENDFSGFNYQLLISELVENFSRLLETDSCIVSKIISFLTFDESSQKSSLINSHFVKIGSERISILYWNVVSTNPNLLFSSALAKRSRRNIYENLIQKIEQRSVERIALAIQNAKYIVLKEKVLVDQENRKIRPDLIVYDPSTYQLLIVDYKHAIPPFNASEVANRLKDLDKWIEQVRRYLRFANKNRNIFQELGFETISKVDGLLLFRYPMAIPAPLEADITFGDWESLSVILSNTNPPSINEILRFYRSARDADQYTRNWKIDEEFIEVGTWTYKRPIIVA